jgi:hypothetical protein
MWGAGSIVLLRHLPTSLSGVPRNDTRDRQSRGVNCQRWGRCSVDPEGT